MRLFGARRAAHVAGDAGHHGVLRREGGVLTAVASAVALLFSSYSVYETSVRRPDLRLFVPPTIQYSDPYQNDNFEVFVVPVTVANVGARSGAVLALDLEVKNPRTGEKKMFYAAEFGRWTMANAQSGNFEHFAPLAIPGKSSVTASVIFYSRLDETVMQIADGKKGEYQLDRFGRRRRARGSRPDRQALGGAARAARLHHDHAGGRSPLSSRTAP